MRSEVLLNKDGRALRRLCFDLKGIDKICYQYLRGHPTCWFALYAELGIGSMCPTDKGARSQAWIGKGVGIPTGNLPTIVIEDCIRGENFPLVL